MTGHNASVDKLKHWFNVPDAFKTPFRNELVMKMHEKKQTTIPDIRKFQKSIVENWNPSVKVPTKHVIPEVSFRDEIKTDGFVMAVIEMLVQRGMLVVKQENDATHWMLGEHWDKKHSICA